MNNIIKIILIIFVLNLLLKNKKKEKFSQESCNKHEDCFSYNKPLIKYCAKNGKCQKVKDCIDNKKSDYNPINIKYNSDEGNSFKYKENDKYQSTCLSIKADPNLKKFCDPILNVNCRDYKLFGQPNEIVCLTNRIACSKNLENKDIVTNEAQRIVDSLNTLNTKEKNLEKLKKLKLEKLEKLRMKNIKLYNDLYGNPLFGQRLKKDNIDKGQEQMIQQYLNAEEMLNNCWQYSNKESWKKENQCAQASVPKPTEQASVPKPTEQASAPGPAPTEPVPLEKESAPAQATSKQVGDSCLGYKLGQFGQVDPNPCGNKNLTCIIGNTKFAKIISSGTCQNKLNLGEKCTKEMNNCNTNLICIENPLEDHSTCQSKCDDGKVKNYQSNYKCHIPCAKGKTHTFSKSEKDIGKCVDIPTTENQCRTNSDCERGHICNTTDYGKRMHFFDESKNKLTEVNPLMYGQCVVNDKKIVISIK